MQLSKYLESKMSPESFDRLTRELHLIRVRGLPTTQLGKLFKGRRDSINDLERIREKGKGKR